MSDLAKQTHIQTVCSVELKPDEWRESGGRKRASEYRIDSIKWKAIKHEAPLLSGIEQQPLQLCVAGASLNTLLNTLFITKVLLSFLLREFCTVLLKVLLPSPSLATRDAAADAAAVADVTRIALLSRRCLH